MKFSDKLAKQRKDNNLSQEQLADRLGVSRQAVSKWESGSSYPDMDKMIKMCKILNCTLEDLLDDGTISKDKNRDNKINLSNYIHDFLEFITKLSNMLSSMTFKEKIKFIFEMFFLGLILTSIGVIIFAIAQGLTSNILNVVPFNLDFIREILYDIYLIGILVMGVIIFIHLLKVRYLDYFITIEDENIDVKTTEEPVEKKDNKKYYTQSKREKIIIRDPKHSSFSLLNLLVKMIVLIAKIFVIIFIVPVIIMFLFMIFAFIIVACHSIYGLLFLFIALSILSGALIAGLIIYFAYNFVFNQKISFKLSFIIFIISLTSAALFAGLALVSCLNYKYLDNYDNMKMQTKTEYIDMNPNIRIHYDDYEYIIDNSLDKIKLEITYPEDFNYVIYKDEYVSDENEDLSYIYVYLTDADLFKLYNLVKDDFKNHIIRNYDSNDMIKVKVYLSQENYNIIHNS